MSTALAVRARGLTRSYRSGDRIAPVLRGIDLEIPAGAFAVITGPSGCGKSTLLNLVGAIDTVEAGTLEVVGTRLDGASAAARRRFRRDAVGFVFQNFNLLPTLTAAENVRVGLEPLGLGRAEIAGRVGAALADVGLGAEADRFPDQLSIGEQQRVAVARAVAKQPKLLLADEPTGALDRANSLEVVQLLERLRRERGMTCVVVTHDPEVADAASHRFHLLDGRIETP